MLGARDTATPWHPSSQRPTHPERSAQLHHLGMQSLSPT